MISIQRDAESVPAALSPEGERTRSVHSVLTLQMSRAFVREEGPDDVPSRDFALPARDDPGFDAAAAEALLEGARTGETASAEQATGYYWGEPRLAEHVRRILERARREGDDRLEQVAARYLG